jgi:hypothetical protein
LISFKQLQGEARAGARAEEALDLIHELVTQPLAHLPYTQGSIRKRLLTPTHPHTLRIIICYFLNLFISYQPVTCCLNTSSSCGRQGFLSGRRNQISIVSIFSFLSAFLQAEAGVECADGDIRAAL